MKTTLRPAGRTRLKRRIIAVCVTAEFAALVLLAARTVVFHHRAPLVAVAFLAVGAVCGLDYLRVTRGRP